VIAVTGASGFIGRAVVDVLAQAGETVLAVSRTPVAHSAGAALRVSDYAALVPPVPGAVLVHLAEPRDIAAVETDAEGHARATLGVVEALLARDWGHMIYVSSGAVYGDAVDHPRREIEPVDARNAYAAAKHACEQAVLARGGGVLRLANVYGPGMAANNVIGDVLKQLDMRAAVVVRNATPVRDFLWIEDAARGIAAAARRRASGIFNLGTGHGTSVGDLVRMILDLAGQGSRQIEAQTQAAGRSTLVLDAGRSARELGWTPATPLARGLSMLLGRDR
jgi:nucleoside-diphosphate-sugar epimerase